MMVQAIMIMHCGTQLQAGLSCQSSCQPCTSSPLAAGPQGDPVHALVHVPLLVHVSLLVHVPFKASTPHSLPESP